MLTVQLGTNKAGIQICGLLNNSKSWVSFDVFIDCVKTNWNSYGHLSCSDFDLL